MTAIFARRLGKTKTTVGGQLFGSALKLNDHELVNRPASCITYIVPHERVPVLGVGTSATSK